MKGVVVSAALLVTAGSARADRAEAAIELRPTAALAYVAESGTSATAIGGGGLALGVAYGARDWLDLGATVLGQGFARARYASTTQLVDGAARAGGLSRATRIAQVRIAATLRLGALWVPVLELGVGAGARLRSAPIFTAAGEMMPTQIDGDAAPSTTLDVLALARIGLDRRLDARWSVGASVSVAHCFGMGAPDLDLVDATVTVTYRWYPNR